MCDNQNLFPLLPPRPVVARSLCVIIIEGTSNIHFLLPIVITSIIAKYVGSLFNDSLYDIAIHFKKIPFLEPDPIHHLTKMTASQCMSTNTVVLYGIEQVGTLVDILRRTECTGYPIISNNDGSFIRRGLGRHC